MTDTHRGHHHTSTVSFYLLNMKQLSRFFVSVTFSTVREGVLGRKINGMTFQNDFGLISIVTNICTCNIFIIYTCNLYIYISIYNIIYYMDGRGKWNRIRQLGARTERRERTVSRITF